MRWRLTIFDWLVLIVVAAFLGIFPYYWIQEFRGKRDGGADAQADIAAGRLALVLGGKAQSHRPILVRLCKQRYGISLDYRFGCVIDDYQRGYLKAYNGLMTARIFEVSPDFSLEQLTTEARKIASAD